MRTTAARRLGWGATAVLLVALGACGSGGDDEPPAAAETGPGRGPATVVDEDAKAMVFAECMRANGLDMAEPAPGEDGFLDAFHAVVENVDEATAGRAIATCDGFFPTYGEVGHGSNTAATVALAECLRGQGLDVPDNLFANGALGAVEPSDLRSALAGCRDVVAGVRR